MSTNAEQALVIAARFITAEEGCHLHAYPDSRSEMGKALGNRGINIVGRTGVVPAGVAHLNGDPWTIGKGITGPTIKQGLEWTAEYAEQRFVELLPAYRNMAERAWPGMSTLHPLAQAALISLAWNRGPGLKRDTSDPLDRRREMRELRPAVVARDYARMAELIKSMARIWEHEKQGGLVKRRHNEAELCARAARETAASGGFLIVGGA